MGRSPSTDLPSQALCARSAKGRGSIAYAMPKRVRPSKNQTAFILAEIPPRCKTFLIFSGEIGSQPLNSTKIQKDFCSF
jgi:hypothetical protein